MTNKIIQTTKLSILLFPFFLIIGCTVDGGHSLTRSSEIGTISSLSGLTLSSGSLTPAFDSSTLSYTVSVGFSASSITVTPTAAQSSASITVNGSAVSSGSASSAVSLTVGANTVTVLVTAQDGTQTTYSLTVTRAAASSNANLSALTISAASFAPTFLSATTSYIVMMSNLAANFTVTPTAADSGATIQTRINGGSYSAVSSGGATSAYTPTNGANTFDIQVTAEDGTLKTYSIDLTYGVCGAGRYSDAVNACAQVGLGYWSPPADNTRTACANKPANSVYTSPTASSANCPWSCDEGYLTTNGTSCDPVPNASRLACNDNEVGIGLYGRDGAIIDRLGIRCQQIENNTLIAGTKRNGPDYGGNGGGPFNSDNSGTYDCPAGYALFEVDGNLATWLGDPRTGEIRWRCVSLSDGTTLSNWYPDPNYFGNTSDRGPFNFKCGTSPNLFGQFINAIIIDDAGGAAFTGDTLGISCR